MSHSVTLLFPGQGSQYAGMGKSLADSSLFEKASGILDIPLKTYCFEGPDEELKQTQITQPAILTHSIALYEKFKQQNIKVSRVLGHSVGEYSALVAAGVIKFEDAVRAVNLRGKFMQEAVPAGVGKMIAVLRVPEHIVKEACETVSQDDSKVMPANFNDPGQIVISGEARACERAQKYIEDNFEGRARFIELNVSAPFHCSLMQPAADALENVLREIPFKQLEVPYVANIDAKEYQIDTDPSLIKENLIKQVCGSVLWTQSIASLPEDTVFVECGPGKVLAGLVKKINPKAKVVTLDKEGSFQELVELLK